MGWEGVGSDQKQDRLLVMGGLMIHHGKPLCFCLVCVCVFWSVHKGMKKEQIRFVSSVTFSSFGYVGFA